MGQCLQSQPANKTQPNNQHQHTDKDTHLIQENSIENENGQSTDIKEMKPCECSEAKCQNKHGHHNKHIQKYRCKKCNGSGYIQVTRFYGFPWYRHGSDRLQPQQ